MAETPEVLALIILDGWGLNPESTANAVRMAKTPFIDDLYANYPNCQLLCSGEAVGLPGGIMGNSEVGHLNIGAGRVVHQDLVRIDRAIADGSIRDNAQINTLFSNIEAAGGALHLMGLLSDGGVHSHIEHLFALLELAASRNVAHVWVHAILDGRDTPPDSGVKYLQQLQEGISRIGCGNVATVCGRYYAMDRDTRWQRVERAYRLYTRGEGSPEMDPVAAVGRRYRSGETDEFIKPLVMVDGEGLPMAEVRDGDGILFFNFRADRAREITRAFTDPEFSAFIRDPAPDLSGYVCMTLYDEDFDLPVAFPPQHLTGILGEVVSLEGLSQLRIAETEKYAHVTYFLNGGEETPFSGEDRCLIPSPRNVATYDLKPEMSAKEVTGEMIQRIQSGKYDLMVLNYANMDMVGHTGVLEAAIRACETIDGCLSRIVKEIQKRNGVAIVTADHGNAEKMIDNDGQIHTAHTLNPVPFLLVDETRKNVTLRDGILGDIAPTILDILKISRPPEMSGNSLLT